MRRAAPVIRLLPRPKAFAFFLLVCAPLMAAPKNLVVGFGKAHPITYKDKNGHAAGFAVDVLTEAARREGVTLTWIPTASSADAEERLAGGKIDLMAAGMVSPQRQQKFHVSEPWWFNELTLLTRKDIQGGVRRLALSPIYVFLAEKAFPGAILLPDRFGSANAAAVCSGSADGALITRGDLHDIFLHRPKECAEADVELQSGDTGIIVELAVISRRSEQAVAERLRRHIDEMALDGALARFAARHPPIPTSGTLRLAERVRNQSRTRVWTILGFVVAPVFVWMLLAYYRERRRERQSTQSGVTELSEGLRTPRARRFMVAVTVMLAAICVRYVLVPIVGYRMPWVLQAFAVAIAAQYGGIGPGLLATGIAVLLGGFMYPEPRIWGFLPVCLRNSCCFSSCS